MLFRSSLPFFKIYIGGLGHPPASSDLANAEADYIRSQLIRWFDQWLKGDDTGILAEPRVTLAPERTEDWSTNSFRLADAVPLPGTTPHTLFINSAGLTDTPPGLVKPQKLPPTARGLDVLTALLKLVGINDTNLITSAVAVNDILNSGAADILDPKMFTQTDGNARRLGYNSPLLAADLTIIGAPVARLYVSAKKPGACYFVQVEEKFANGNVKLVTRGAFKDTASDSKSPHAIAVPLFAVNHTFQAGSQIKLLIASRDYPFFLPNLHQPKAVVYRDTDHPSALELPVAP